MNRPTRAQTLMNVAETFAFRGTCDRKQVGAVIAIEGRIISVGYNGAPPGLPHCEENNHGHGSWKEGGIAKAELLGCHNATHAEANALAFAARHGVPTDGSDLYVTVSPCDTCARLLIAAGVKRVWYLEAYRDESGIMLLERAGVKTLQMSTVPAVFE